MIFKILDQVCNVILDPVLIFGLWIFPEMGVRGAALATVCSLSIGSILPLWYILSNRTAYLLRLSHCLPNWGVIKDIYRVGLPSMLMETTEGVAFALLNHVAAGFGSVVLASLGIALRIVDLAFMPVLGRSPWECFPL
jgi:Na+-driven multidrug efflux pump